METALEGCDGSCQFRGHPGSSQIQREHMDLGDILDAELIELTDELTDGWKAEKVSNGHGGDATGRKTEKEEVLGGRSS